ncbi:hypothetical protein CFP71_01375 [Amycolatopsis thailandensis]|uniref:Uncharacterized protein n=1 Tax=Amycolatopsis thailandensis TaxID=589330 RepID=A0A229SIK2_9PSEU|nr:hypothetical protein [Amycolatopsis thailandensis]OXM58693.1 hypothetical protein CFP71_01375 [Amycolatopsis thailandensis]
MKQAAATRIAEAEALAAFAKMKIVPVENPIETLQALAGEITGWKGFLRDRLGELTSLGYAGATGEQVRATVSLYAAALDKSEKVLVSIARLNLDERLVTIRGKQADLLAEAIEVAVREVGLDGMQAARARGAVVRHLRMVDEGDAAA